MIIREKMAANRWREGVKEDDSKSYILWKYLTLSVTVIKKKKIIIIRRLQIFL